MRHIEGRISEEMKNHVDEKNISGSEGLILKGFESLEDIQHL